jgi:Fic family protein
MKPCRIQKLPPSHLDWQLFVGVLGKAHATLARFSLVTNGRDHPFLQSREIRAQLPAERALYKRVLTASSKAIHHHGLSSTFLCDMHRILKKEQDGKFRTKQNWIGPKNCIKKEAYFLPPSYKTVPKSMESLVAYGDAKEKDPLVQLAIYFAQLLIIHPFMDGNGRLARAMIPLFLYKKGITSTPRFYLSAYFKRHRLDYFVKLYLISAAGNWEEWIRFFLQGIVEEGERVIRQCLRFRSSSSSS